MTNSNKQIKGLLPDFLQTAKLAWPVVLGQVGNMLIQVFDNAMIGNISSHHLAAATIANSIFFLVIIMGIGMVMIFTPLVSEARGNNNEGRLTALFRDGLFLYAIVGIILTLATLGMSRLIPFMGQEVAVVPLAISYLDILSLSILPMMVFLHYKHFMEGMAEVRAPMYAMVIMVVFNIAGNWALIYGNMGFDAYGLDGAGYATVAARILGLAAVFLFASGRNDIRHHANIFRLGRINVPNMKRLTSLGIPAGLQLFFEAGAFGATALMVGWIGYREQAAHNIAIHMASITFSIAIGVSAAASIRVGEALGKKDFLGLRKAGFAAILLGMVVMFFGGAIFFLFNKQLPAFYNKESYVIDFAAQLLIIAAIFQLSDGIQAVAAGALRGIADVRIPAVITFVAYWIVAIPAGYLLAFKFGMGVIGLWIGLVAGLTASAVLLTARFLLRTAKMLDEEGQRTND